MVTQIRLQQERWLILSEQKLYCPFKEFKGDLSIGY